MAEKLLDGLLLVFSSTAMSQWDANKLRNLGAVVIVKRPHTEVTYPAVNGEACNYGEKGPLLPDRHTGGIPRYVPSTLFSRYPYPIGGGLGVRPVRHEEQAAHTDQTAHPQLHAGKVALRHADLCMLRHRLG